MPATNIDVNVHPTKREVHFLYEDEIIDAIQRCFQALLRNANESRSFETQTLLSSSMVFDETAEPVEGARAGASSEDIGVEEGEDYTGPGCKLRSQAPAQSQPTARGRVPALLRLSSPAAEKSVSEGKEGANKKPNTLAPQKMVRTDARAPAGGIETFLVQTDATGAVPSRPLSSQASRKRRRAVVDSAAEAKGGERRRKGVVARIDESDVVEVEDSASSDDDQESIAASRLTPRFRAAASPRHRAGGGIDGEEDSEDETTSNEVTSNGELEVDRLSSVNDIKTAIASKCHVQMRKILQDHVYVGVVNKTHALVQYKTKIYLVQHATLTRELFYQRVFHCFGKFPRITLETPLPLSDLLKLSGEASSGAQEGASGREKLDLLKDRSEMLDEYFSIGIDAQGRLWSLPELLPNHIPEISSFPTLLLLMCERVDWSEERSCFESLAKVLAEAYSCLPPLAELPTCGAAAACDDDEECPVKTPSIIDRRNARYILKNVLFPALRKHLAPPETWEGTAIFLEIACLQKLYRIFERC